MAKDKKQEEHSIDNKKLEEMEQALEEMKKKLQEAEDITKRAQSDYFRLKMDMDSLQQRTEQLQKDSKIDSLVTVCRKLLPFVSQLQTTVDSLPKNLEDNSRAQGVGLVYNKMSQVLAQLNIHPISAEEGEPDLHIHIPVGTEPTEDKKLQGKIIKQLEQGYIYKDEFQEKVIIPAKVIVGA